MEEGCPDAFGFLEPQHQPPIVPGRLHQAARALAEQCPEGHCLGLGAVLLGDLVLGAAGEQRGIDPVQIATGGKYRAHPILTRQLGRDPEL